MRITLIMLLFSFCYSANSQVKSKSFQFLLNTMLSDKTPVISIKDAAANKNNYTFLDAREAKEYNVSHIPNAHYVGATEFKLSLVSHLPKSKPLIVYCSIGKRSENITNTLLANGFTNVRNLYGGIFEWVNEGYMVVDNENKISNRVHAYGRLWGQWLKKGEKVY